jgi:zinc transporter, ZIP family
MSDALHYVFIYIAIPVVATIGGGIVCVFYSSGPGLRIGIQHLAAGLVFAAVATGLLPEMLRVDDLPAVILGFTIGIALMVGVKWFTQDKKKDKSGNGRQPRSLVFAAAIDYVVDGLLIGIGFSVGAKAGGLLTIALSLEGLFLAMAVTSTLNRKGVAMRWLVITSLMYGLLLAIGAIAGAAVFGRLSGSIHAVVLSFGAAALIYLVTEELLVEAHDHETPENPLTAAIFFVGFLLMISIEMSF